MGNSDHGTEYMRVGRDDGELPVECMLGMFLSKTAHSI